MMRFHTRHLPPQTAARLRQFHFWRQLLRLGRVVFACIAVYVLLLLLAIHLDRFVFMETAARWAMLIGVHAAAGLVALVGLAVMVWRWPTARQIAYELESRLEAADELFVTSESVFLQQQGAAGAAAAGTQASQPLAEQLRAATERFAQSMARGRLARDRRCRDLGILAAILLLIPATLAIPAGYELPLMLHRFYAPGANLPRASFIDLEVSPGDAIIGRGGEVVIQARVQDRTPPGLGWLMDLLGASPRGAQIRIEPAKASATGLPDADVVRTESMARVQRELYLLARSELGRSFHYQVMTGNAASRRHEVRVVEQPRVTDLSVTLTPPAYTEQEPQQVTALDEVIRILPRTQVELSFSSDQPIERAWLQIDDQDGPVEVSWDAESGRGVYQFTPESGMELQVVVRNTLGFENVDRRALRFVIQEDLPPRVTLQYPPAEVEAVASELLPIDARIEDDLGVEEVRLSYLVNPDVTADEIRQSVPIELNEPGQPQMTITPSFDLADTGVGPGDSVLLQVRARDAAGNEGVSRDVLIHVVPFTRGAHERRRINTLRFLAQALSQLAEDDTAAGVERHPAEIDVATWDAITTTAKTMDVPLPDRPTIDSLLRLLEIEHFLTDRPDDQQDLRHLTGIVRLAADPSLMPSAEEAKRYRQTQFQQLPSQVLGPLVHYRQARNLMWRLHGMQREALRLDDELAALAEQAAQNEGQEVSLAPLNRRSTLYLDALQNLGDDLQELAETTRTLDLQPLKDAFADINTAGYFLARGGLSRRRESARTVASELSAVLERTQHVLPVLLIEHLQARRALTGRYHEAVQIVAAPETNAPPAERWLMADLALLEQNPVSPMVDRLLRLRLRETLFEGDASQRQAATRRLRQGQSDPPPAVRDERALAAAIGRTAQIERVRASRQLGEDERRLEVALIRLEAHAPADVDQARRRLASLLSEPTPRDDDPADPLARSRSITRAAAEHVGDPARDVAQRIVSLQAALAATQEAIGRVLERLDGGESESVTEAAAELARSLEAEAHASSLLRAAIIEQLTRVPGAAGERTDALDALLLKWQAAEARFHAKVRDAIDTVRSMAEGEVDADQLAVLQAEGDLLGSLHGVLLDQFDEAAEQFSEGTLDTEAQAARQVLRSTQRIAALLLERTAGEAGPEAAIEVMNQVEGAPEVWIASAAPMFLDGLARASAAKALVERESVDTEAVEQALARARASFDRAARQLDIDDADPRVAQVGERIAPFVAAIARLQREDLSKAEAVSRVRFGLSELVDDAQNLSQQLTRQAPIQQALWFLGGPVIQWTDRYDADVRHTRQRLTELAAASHERAILAALAPLRGRVEPRETDVGYAWASTVHRMVRSPLFYSGGERTGGGRGDETGDAFLKFLERELEEARQQSDLKLYAEPSRQYLELIGDYLRY